MRGLALQDTAFLGAKRDPVLDNWVARVATNVGSAPTNAQQYAVNTFLSEMRAAGVFAKRSRIEIMCVGGGIAGSVANYATARTPLVVGTGGNDPTVPNVAGGEGATDVTGIHGNTGAGFYLSTGISPANILGSSASGGISIYVPSLNGNTNPAGIECGSYDAGSANIMSVAVTQSGNSKAYIFKDTATNVSVATSGIGFYSANRLTASDLKLYFAKTASAWAQIGANAGAEAGVLWAGANDLKMFGLGFGGAITANSSSYISYFSVGVGLTSAEGQAEFNAVQKLRLAFGGGTA